VSHLRAALGEEVELVIFYRYGVREEDIRTERVKPVELSDWPNACSTFELHRLPDR
jgi:hypothetical protein